MSLSRLAFLRDVADRDHFWEGPAFISAFVGCLSPSEACDALDVAARLNDTLRGALLRKLHKDCEAGGFRSCHRNLLERLLVQYPTLPAHRRRGCGFCIDSLLNVAPARHRTRILRFFLNSSHVDMRRRGYKALRKTWRNEFTPTVRDAWSRYADPECALLITERFPLAFLKAHLSALQEALPHWGLAKLYIRLGASSPSVVRRLATIDEITYAYVVAKLGRRIDAKDAVALVDRNSLDDRVGLLIWSLGQMGHWTALTGLVGRAMEFEEKRKAHILGKVMQAGHRIHIGDSQEEVANPPFEPMAGMARALGLKSSAARRGSTA